jgi:glycosyltransferase involved in cell wall biosynthesis
MHAFDITAVINGHNEGLLAPSSLRSMVSSAKTAGQNGITVEFLAILDKPDRLTLEVFEEFAQAIPQFRVVTVELGDLGYARNTGAQMAGGEWTAFLDADDIWSDNWLTVAYQAAEADKREVVWHPEVNVYFGVSPHIFVHADMDDPNFNLATLAYTNPWTSLSFVSTDFVRRVPYTGTHLREYIGYEDWSWNVDAIGQGAIHKTARGSAHAIRTKHTSLVKQTTAAGCIRRPSDFLRRHIQSRRAP